MRGSLGGTCARLVVVALALVVALFVAGCPRLGPTPLGARWRGTMEYQGRKFPFVLTLTHRVRGGTAVRGTMAWTGDGSQTATSDVSGTFDGTWLELHDDDHDTKLVRVDGDRFGGTDKNGDARLLGERDTTVGFIDGDVVVAEPPHATPATLPRPVKLMLLAALLVQLAIAIGRGGVFKKAGQSFWASFVPIYAEVVMLRITGKSGWMVLGFFVPIVNALLYVVVISDLAKAFGKGLLFAIGLLFVPWLCFPIIGFDDSEYL